MGDTQRRGPRADRDPFGLGRNRPEDWREVPAPPSIRRGIDDLPPLDLDLAAQLAREVSPPPLRITRPPDDPRLRRPARGGLLRLVVAEDVGETHGPRGRRARIEAEAALWGLL